MENIHYKKVIINDASDLPEEEGCYYVAKKELLKSSGLKPMIYTVISKNKWLKEVAWYLFPVKEMSDEEIKEWAIDIVMKTIKYPDLPYREGLITGAKFYRDRDKTE